MKAYQEAGVDAIFLVGVKTTSDLDAIASEIKLPIILGGAGKELQDRPWLAARKVRVCLQGHQPFAAAVRAVHDTLKALRAGAAPDQLQGVASDEMMKQFMRNADYLSRMKEWL